MTSSTLIGTNDKVAARTTSPLPPPAKTGLTVSTSGLARGYVLCVRGSASVADLRPLEQHLTRMLACRPHLVVVDFSELTMLSSLAMGLLVGFRRDLARWGGRVKFASVCGPVREALEVARIAELFEFHLTVADAVAAA